jgi:hypothetical protein
MKHILLGVLVLGGVLLSGCSGRGHEGDKGTDTRTPAVAALPAQPLDLCQLMPVADVAGILQAHDADTVAEQKRGGGGMCSYLHVPKPGDYRTKLLIDFTRMPSAEQAQAALATQRRDFTGRGMSVTTVSGVGDEAFVSDDEGNEGIKLRAGPYLGQINLHVEERAPASLRPAVLALGKQVVARLP